jgi:hypothetical protein
MLTGAASDVNLTPWNRGDDSQILTTGDGALLDTWHDNMRARRKSATGSPPIGLS